MIRCFPALPVLVAFTLATGCDNRGEQSDAPPPAKEKPTAAALRAECDADLTRLMSGFGHVVKGVHNEDTWARAKPQVERILADTQRVTQRLQELPPPTAAEFKKYSASSRRRENALQEELGDRDAFLTRLPSQVATELLALNQQFHVVMGTAQQTLHGPPPGGPGSKAPPRTP